MARHGMALYECAPRAVTEAAANGAIDAGPVPLVDCLVCGVRQAELLVRLGLPKPRAGSYAAPSGRELVAVDPAIARRFEDR